jgi:hypothetical protein
MIVRSGYTVRRNDYDLDEVLFAWVSMMSLAEELLGIIWIVARRSFLASLGIRGQYLVSAAIRGTCKFWA